MTGRTLMPAALMLILGCASAVEVEQAMVKIYATNTPYYYYIPWITDAPREVFGSGCVIEGDLILTNAHVVSDVTYLQVRREGDPKRYTARVEAVSHEADLALLSVNDPAFFRGVRPLELGELPRARERVTVYGYPQGGDALSTTQGVVSRIETSSYSHSNLSLLSVQIDAAINPGNSGGPAIVNDRIAGVAMQTLNQSENIGYVIPVPVIRHFLDDLKDGVHHGFPSAGLGYQDIANPALSRRYGIEDEQTGVLVTHLAHGSPASRVLRNEDVILEIDGHPVAGDGTIALLPGVRTSLGHLITRRQVGETLSLTVMRSGSPVTLEMTLDATHDDLCLVPNAIYDRAPSYLVYGGLVFMPLTRNYLDTWGPEWYNLAPGYLTAPYLHDNYRTPEKKGLVILSFVLPSETNTGYQDAHSELVETVNDEPVEDFLHLVHLLDSASTEYIEIVTHLGTRIVLNREEVLAEHDEILLRYGIPEDRHL